MWPGLELILAIAGAIFMVIGIAEAVDGLAGGRARERLALYKAERELKRVTRDALREVIRRT